MKKLFEETQGGYSWSNRHEYYLCETQEEYDSLIEKYAKHENGHLVFDEVINTNRWVDNPIQVSIGDIQATPTTVVSDGFCSYGGRYFKAKGITIKYVSQGLSTDYSSYQHYIKPGSIETDEKVKTENWWT